MRTSIQKRAVVSITMLLIAIAIILGSLIYYVLKITETREVALKMNNVLEEEASSMNLRLVRVETSVNDIVALADELVPTAESMKDTTYRQEITSRVADVFAAVVKQSETAVSYYITYDPELVDEVDGFFYVKDDKGQMNYNPVTDIRKYDPEDMEHVGWYTLPKRSGKPMWLEPYYNKNIDRWLISYVVPFYKDGTMIAVIGMDFDFQSIVDEVNGYSYLDHGYAYVTNADGSVHYHDVFFTGTYHGNESISIHDEDNQAFLSGNTKDTTFTYTYDGVRYEAVVTILENGMRLVMCDNYAEVYHQRSVILTIVILLTILTTFVGIIIMQIFTARMVRPLLRITDAMRQIENQDFDINVPEGGEDEIGVLSHGVVVMADALKKQKDLNESALAEKNRNLEKAIREAEHANKAKSDFLSQMSHDLRTPMNAIIGMSVIAEDNLHNPEKLADCLDKIHSSSNYLLSLINDILDMSQIESGKLSFSDGEYSIPALIEKTLLMVSSQMNAHHHHVQAHISNIVHENAIVDGLRLQQVFVNILSNSVKYTADYGQIELNVEEVVTAAADISHYIFTFKDNGIGMTPEFQEKLFSAFSRERDDHQTEVKGTGLGMAITKAIIYHMGGKISVDSTPNQGTTMTVEIDLHTVNQIQEQVNNEILGKEVLIVDDNPHDLENARKAVTKIGLQCDLANNGMEALAKVKKHHENGKDYYAVIADKRMPQMDGFDLTERIRQSVEKHIPVIIFSAYVDAELEEDALKAGADAFVSKPLYSAKLITALRHFEDSKSQKRTVATGSGLGDLDFSDKRVLIVDDMMINLEIAKNLLEMTGAQVETAENGKVAVEKVLTQSAGWYDLVLMDIRMPVMDGYEATKAIRSAGKKYTDELPVYAMSANAYAEDIAKSREFGMNGHITKPIDMVQLKEILTRHLA